MTEFSHFGTVLVVIGLFIAALGLFLATGHKIPFPWRLPGDVFIKGKSFTFYFPITTCLIVSVVLSLIIYLFRSR